MKAMQRSAKGLSKELLKFEPEYSEHANAEIRDRIHLICTELRDFIMPDMRRLSVQGIEVMVAHGRMAFDNAAGLISYLESEKLAKNPSDKH
jgi:hypothetical protein